MCNTSRWKDSDTPGKKVPRKVLRYFLIIPRLQRLYKSRHTAKDMIWHATGKCTEPGKMQHLVDGGAWKKFDMKYPDFAKVIGSGEWWKNDQYILATQVKQVFYLEDPAKPNVKVV
ncbi:hypothetical protein Tco_0504404, partial [Tanacetum coccineum]